MSKINIVIKKVSPNARGCKCRNLMQNQINPATMKNRIKIEPKTIFINFSQDFFEAILMINNATIKLIMQNVKAIRIDSVIFSLLLF